jgi:Mn-dependent DtxR family transcriptional regulator
MTFANPNDPQQCARYQQAFKSLCERGYIQHQSGIQFTLTPAGVEAARKLVGPEP